MSQPTEPPQETYDWSTAATIIYLSIYVSFMIVVSMHVYLREHKICCSRSWFRSIWAAKKVYGQALVLLYDTSTDIGVLVAWYYLYKDPINYSTVDMAVFFWLSFSVLIFYRIINMMVMWTQYGRKCFTLITILALLDMTIFVGIFESLKKMNTVFISKEERDKIHETQKTTYLKRKQSRIESVVQSAMADEKARNQWISGSECQVLQKNDWVEAKIIGSYMDADSQWVEVQYNESHTAKLEKYGEDIRAKIIGRSNIELNAADTDLANNVMNEIRQKHVTNTEKYTDIVKSMVDLDANEVRLAKKNAEKEIASHFEPVEPVWIQFLCLLIESAFESMPQVVIQAVYLVRSANDPVLAEGSNRYLVLTSLIASILSISNKFYFLDEQGVEERAIYSYFHYEEICSYCYMVNPLYVFRVFWRFNHILCRFTIFSLCWLVLGGGSVGIYIGITQCFYCCYSCYVYWFAGERLDGAVSLMILGLVGMPIIEEWWKAFVPRWIDNSIMLIIITLFANFSWECVLCSDEEHRLMDKSEGIYVFVIMGWISYGLDITLFFCLLLFRIKKQEEIRMTFFFGSDML